MKKKKISICRIGRKKNSKMVPLTSAGTNKVSSFMSYQGILSKCLNVSATSFKGVFNDVSEIVYGAVL